MKWKWITKNIDIFVSVNSNSRLLYKTPLCCKCLISITNNLFFFQVNNLQHLYIQTVLVSPIKQECFQPLINSNSNESDYQSAALIRGIDYEDSGVTLWVGYRAKQLTVSDVIVDCETIDEFYRYFLRR